jgi:hypothetical protein
MAAEENGRLSKIEELLIKHDERMGEHAERMLYHEQRMDELQCMQESINRTVENTERLLVLEGDRIDRLERTELRQNELFAEISEQLRNLHRP